MNTTMDTKKIYLKNTNSYIDIPVGNTLLDIIKQDKSKLVAYVDNKLKDLNFKIYNPHSIEFLDYSHPDGYRCYSRTLCFLLQRVIHKLYPQYQLVIDYNLPNGLYCELIKIPIEKLDNYSPKFRQGNEVELNADAIKTIIKEIQSLINKKLPITQKEILATEAIEIYKSHHQYDKAELLHQSGKFLTSVYEIDGFIDTFYGPLLYNTGAIGLFNIIKYNKGFCLQIPSQKEQNSLQEIVYQERLYDVFKENASWCNIIGVKDIASVNSVVANGKSAEMIRIAEALHERKYASIADKIFNGKDKTKLVLIAGPSSSGKTTTSMRVALHLKVLGLNPVVIAMDNYFVNREDTPRDEKGEYDFECLKAMDLEFMNKQINQLFNGEEIELPKFNFAEGKRYFDGEKIKLKENDILIMEGIHALNPELTSQIADEKKFRIYASALTSLSIDENNSISTTDNRMLRRMVRDNNFRGTSAEQTILRWASVRAGEQKNIFPFQENADVMFNSSLIYELPVLKYYAEPLLRRISPISPAYAESIRLLQFLSKIIDLNLKEQEVIPPTSVLREFIGGSSYTY